MVESETKKAKAVDYDKSHTTILTGEEVHNYPGYGPSPSRLTVVLSKKLHRKVLVLDYDFVGEHSQDYKVTYKYC